MAESKDPPRACDTKLSVYNPTTCAKEMMQQHRVIIIGLINCPYSRTILHDAQTRLRKLGIEPMMTYYDDHHGRVGELILHKALKDFLVRDWATDGKRIISVSQISQIQGVSRGKDDTRMLFPQMLWRQETSLDSDMAWTWNGTQIQRMIECIIHLTMMKPPVSSIDIETILTNRDFIIFAYEWCGYYQRLLETFKKYKQRGYTTIPMDNASEDMKTTVARYLKRPGNRFTSPLVVIRDPMTHQIVHSGNHDETVEYLTRKFGHL